MLFLAPMSQAPQCHGQLEFYMAPRSQDRCLWLPVNPTWKMSIVYFLKSKRFYCKKLQHLTVVICGIELTNFEKSKDEKLVFSTLWGLICKKVQLFLFQNTQFFPRPKTEREKSSQSDLATKGLGKNWKMVHQFQAAAATTSPSRTSSPALSCLLPSRVSSPALSCVLSSNISRVSSPTITISEISHDSGEKTEITHDSGKRIEISHDSGEKTEISHDSGEKTEISS